MTTAVAQVSGAYEFAERLHSQLFNDPEARERRMAEPGEVSAEIAQPSGSERLTITGTLDGQTVSQRLTRSPSTGQFYLATAFQGMNGEVVRKRITKESPEAEIEVLEESLFMDPYRRASQTSLF